MANLTKYSWVTSAHKNIPDTLSSSWKEMSMHSWQLNIAMWPKKVDHVVLKSVSLAPTLHRILTRIGGGQVIVAVTALELWGGQIQITWYYDKAHIMDMVTCGKMMVNIQ